MAEQPLITDEAVKAVANALADLGDKGLIYYATPDQAAQIALDALITHHEGERPCERCDDEDWLFDQAQHIYRTTSLDWDRSRGLIYEKARASCPDCGGTGKVATTCPVCGRPGDCCRERDRARTNEVEIRANQTQLIVEWMRHAGRAAGGRHDALIDGVVSRFGAKHE